MPNQRLLFVGWIIAFATSCVAVAAERENSREVVQKLLAATVAIEFAAPEERKAAPLENRPVPSPKSSDASIVPTTPVPGRQIQLEEASPDRVALSSGTVVSADGLIVVPHSPIGANATVEVTFSDGRKAVARRVVADLRTQLDLLKVDLSELQPIELAEGEAQLGEEVLTVMCEGIHDRRAGRGIVVALHRTVGNIFDLLQTDIAATRMSAGAPLANANGQLIAVMLGREGAVSESSALSLAIPVEYVRDLLTSLERGESVIQRPWLGVVIQPSEAGRGAVVGRVLDDSPAEAAGLQSEDIIVGIGAVEIRAAADVQREMAKCRVGEEVVIRVRRGEEEREVKATIAALPAREPSEEPKRTVPAPGKTEIQFTQPPAVYMLTPDGKLKAMPKPPLDSEATGTTAEQYRRMMAEHYRALLQGEQQLAVPPSTLIVQRSDLEKQLAGLTRALDALQKQVAQLNEQVKQLTQRLEERR